MAGDSHSGEAASSTPLRPKPKSKRPHCKSRTGCVNCRKRRVKVRAALSTLVLHVPSPQRPNILFSATSRSQAANHACGAVRHAFTLLRVPRRSRHLGPRLGELRQGRHHMSHCRCPPSRLRRRRQPRAQRLRRLGLRPTHPLSRPSQQPPRVCVHVELPHRPPSSTALAILPSSTTGRWTPA